MKILLVDNFDSFTYNLVHYLEAFCDEVVVFQNNQFEEIIKENFDKLVLSPGPGLPNESGALMQIIAHYWGKKPILGVCLGMQALGQFTGQELFNMPDVRHGVQEVLNVVEKDELFDGLPEVFLVGLYHSWAVRLHSNEWIATSYSENKILLSFRHQKEAVFGVQFHPESVLSEHGKKMLQNFVEKA